MDDNLAAGIGPVKVGLVGCGNISGIYLKNLTGRFESARIVACSDMVGQRAVQTAAEHGIRACSVEQLMADPEIEIVLNLTIPSSHAAVARAALSAGKHVHGEKPLAVTLSDGEDLVRMASGRGLRIGSAPDTFLGAGLQTCRKLIDDGWIGRPVAATAFMMCHGHESWHPDPAFYYQIGGGPMFDMGPYYLTALVSLLGPVVSVSGMTSKAYGQRTITSKQQYGRIVDVQVPTHITGLMRFADGLVATIVTSFDVWHSQLPRIEIYGTHGTLSVPDPNGFGGPVLLRTAQDSQWREMPLSHGYAENSRGIGVADLASAIRGGRAHRAHGDMALHVLEVMHAFHTSSDSGREQPIVHACSRPAPLAPDLLDGRL